MKPELTDTERQEVRRAFDRTSEQGWGLALGFLAAIVLFVATAVLVVRGGEDMGQHLGLLSVYLPGYSVSWAGAFVGAAYMFFLGYGAGRTIATVYNRVVPNR
jgi:hypothetical protein